MPKASPIQTTFATGELGPELSGRVDLEEYQAGVTRMENFIPTIQGPAVRRAGTRFVNEVKNSAVQTWFVPFEFSTDQAYVLEFGNQYIRFYSNHGQVNVSGIFIWTTATAYTVGDVRRNGTVYYYCQANHTSGTFATDLANGLWYTMTGTILEVPTPFQNLTDADGNFEIDYVQSGDVIYLCQPGYYPYKLSRLGTYKWALERVTFKNGPFEALNPAQTTTIYASAATGTVTLTASASIFTAELVGTQLYLERKLTDDTKMWEVGKSITAGNIRKSDGKFYEALNTATTGTIRPTHSEGSVFDGDNGVQWKFLHPGYGYVYVSAVSGTTATATVINRLPDEVVGSGNATTRWAWGEFSQSAVADQDYPTHVTFFKERLVLARASDQRIWMSVVGDYENFADRDDGGVVTQDSSITIDVVSDKVNKIRYLIPADVLLVGTAGGEHAVRELTTNEALGPGNITCIKISEYGSAPVRPVRVGNSILFVQRAGRKIRELAFSDQAFNADGYGSIDLTILAPHLLPRNKYITQLAYQQEPHSVVWAVRNDGLLLGVRYNANRKAVGWSRHVVGGSAVVEAIQTIPHPDGDRDELWLIVRRTINGNSVRYVEYLEIEWTSADAPADRFYVDSGLTYERAGTFSRAGAVMTMTRVSHEYTNGLEYTFRFSDSRFDGTYAITVLNADQFQISVVNSGPTTGTWNQASATLTNLNHLEGQVVDVLADGATHPQRTVTSGSITLARAASVAHVGLPCPAKLQSLRVTAGAGDGTAQGKTKRIHIMAMRFLDTLGGKAGPAESQLDVIPFRDSGDPMNAGPPAFTGDKVDIAWPSGYDTDGYVWYVNDQPLPATVVAIMPQLHTQDR